MELRRKKKMHFFQNSFFFSLFFFLFTCRVSNDVCCKICNVSKDSCGLNHSSQVSVSRRSSSSKFGSNCSLDDECVAMTPLCKQSVHFHQAAQQFVWHVELRLVTIQSNQQGSLSRIERKVLQSSCNQLLVFVLVKNCKKVATIPFFSNFFQSKENFFSLSYSLFLASSAA